MLSKLLQSRRLSHGLQGTDKGDKHTNTLIVDCSFAVVALLQLRNKVADRFRAL